MHNCDIEVKAIRSNDPHDWKAFKLMQKKKKVNPEIKTSKHWYY